MTPPNNTDSEVLPLPALAPSWEKAALVLRKTIIRIIFTLLGPLLFLVEPLSCKDYFLSWQNRRKGERESPCTTCFAFYWGK